MKTFLFFLSLWGLSAFAQDDTSWEVNHYEHTRTFVEDGYTYQCDVDERSGYVHLYNKENRWTYEDVIDKRTGEIYTSNLNNPSGLSDEDVQTIFDIINHAFSQEEARRIKDNGIMFTLYINPQTGNVDEVCFNFAIFNDCAKIPLSYYRDIEVKLKEQVHADVTEEGKHLNFILVGSMHVPTGRSE